MDRENYVKLSEISELITKGTTPTTIGFSFVNDGINFLKIECFDDNGDFLYNKISFITKECHDKMKRSQLKDGDILFSIAGAIGRVAIVTEDMLPANTNQALAIIRITNKEIYLPYVKLILGSPIVVDQFEKKKQGVAQLNLSLKDINELKIPLPEKNEQIKICKLFEKIKYAIKDRYDQIHLYDELVKSRFIELFGSINNNEFGYEIKAIQEVCKPIKDGTHQTPAYTEDNINGFKFLSSKDVVTGKVDWDHLKYIPEELHNKLYARIAPKKGDILLAKNGTTGIAAIVDREEVFDIYVSLALLRPLDNVNNVYLLHAINSVETKRQFNERLKGVGVPNLHLGEIKVTRIIVPPMDKQLEFVEFAEKVDKSKFEIQQSLDKYQQLFDSLMQEYFG